MSALNNPDNFAGRVNYAAACISSGKRHHGRAFDNCFENYDGDLVVVALVRRAENNPKLAANLFNQLSQPLADEVVAKYAHVPTRQLSVEAAKVRAAKRAEFDTWLAQRDREEA